MGGISTPKRPRFDTPQLISTVGSNTINIPDGAVALHVLGAGGGAGGISNASASSGGSTGAVGAFKIDLRKFPGLTSVVAVIAASAAAASNGNNTTLTLNAACKITWKGGNVGTVGTSVAPGAVKLTYSAGLIPLDVGLPEFTWPYGWAYPLAGVPDVANSVGASSDMRSLWLRYGESLVSSPGDLNNTGGPPVAQILGGFAATGGPGVAISSCATWAIPPFALAAGLTFATAGTFTATAGSGAALFNGHAGDGINGAGTSACNATGYGNGGGSCTSGTAGSGSQGVMVIVFEFE